MPKSRNLWRIFFGVLLLVALSLLAMWLRRHRLVRVDKFRRRRVLRAGQLSPDALCKGRVRFKRYHYVVDSRKDEVFDGAGGGIQTFEKLERNIRLVDVRIGNIGQVRDEEACLENTKLVNMSGIAGTEKMFTRNGPFGAARAWRFWS